MKTRIAPLLILLTTMILWTSCKNDKETTTTGEDLKTEETTPNKPKFVTIVTQSMEFKMADTISSGWNTFLYNNQASETHFFRFLKLPEGVDINNYKSDIDPVFEEGMDLINEGKPAEGFQAFDKLPEWFGETTASGGSGLIAPKGLAITTMRLDPGDYIVECYVKMPNGKFHSTMGMIKQVHVSDQDSGLEPPEAAHTVTLGETGYEFNAQVTAGEHVFKVVVANQMLHENFALTDVNLVKLGANASIEELEAWMVWYNPKGFITPVPAGVSFLGGFNDAVQGSEGYFKVTLEPGNYAFIAEVPDASKKGLLLEFTVN